MKLSIIQSVVLVCTFAVSNVAVAHPGHGEGGQQTGHTVTHYLSEPIHAIPLFAVIGIAAAGVLWRRRGMRTKQA